MVMAVAVGATTFPENLKNSITNFGGVGNGVTSDTSAFTAVIASVTASGGGSVYLPVGSWTTGNFSMPANTEFVADRYARFTTAVDITWADIGVEKGVIYPYFDKGDVRRYGVFPDGVTNWESSYASRMLAIYANARLPNLTVRFVPGFYATGMNLSNAYCGLKFHMEPGAEFGSIIHLISSGNPTYQIISTIARSSNVVTVTTSTAHGRSNGDMVRILDVLGGTTEFNGNGLTITVTGSTTFTYAQTGADESGTVSGTEAYVADMALSNVIITGDLVTYDRVGTVGLLDSYIERIIIKNDTVKHTAYPGAKARGVHIYSATERLSIGEIIVDDCGNGNNTDAAVAIDGNPLAPKSLNIGRILVKKSDVTGVYLMGTGHRIGEIVVNEYSALQNQNVMQGANSLAQCQEGRGVWMNRAWDVSIDNIRVSQNIIDTRTYAKYHVIVDETGNTGVNSSRGKSVRIGNISVRNVRSRGVSFGDRNYNTTGALHAHVDRIEVQLASGATLDSGYYLVACEKNPEDSTCYFGHVEIVDASSQGGMFTASGTVVGFGSIESRGYSTTTNNGVLILAQGRIVGTYLRMEYAGGTGTGPFVYLNGSGANDSSIASIYVNATALISSQAVKFNSVTRAKIGKIRVFNFRNTTGTVELTGLTACTFDDISVEATTSASTVGMLINGITDCQIGRVTISGFATGVKKGAGAIARSTVQTAYVTGNTVDTDVTALSNTALLQSGFQL